MAYHQDCSLIVHQEVLQPPHAPQVQVVCRLVQKHHIRMPEQCLRQQHLDLQPRVEILHQRLMQAYVHPEALQDARGFALRFPASELGIFLLQLGGTDTVLITEVLFHIDGVLLPAAVIKALIAHDDGVQHGIFIVQTLVLLQDRHPSLRVQHHRAACRLQLTGQNLDESGFPGTVGPDDAVTVAGRKLQIHPAEKYGRAELHGKIIDSEHK